MMKLLIIAIVFTIICIVGSASLHERGYCISQGRIILDDEKINIAIDKTIRRYSKKIDIHTNQNDVQLFNTTDRYIDAVDFLAKNKGCCSVVKKSFVVKDWNAVPPEYSDWVFGSVLDSISLQFSVKYTDVDNSVKAVNRKEYFSIDVCGNRGSNEFSLSNNEYLNDFKN